MANIDIDSLIIDRHWRNTGRKTSLAAEDIALACDKGGASS